MSEFIKMVTETRRKLKNRRCALREKQHQLEKDLGKVIYEIEDIDNSLKEMKPLIEFSYTPEYVQSLSERAKKEVEE